MKWPTKFEKFDLKERTVLLGYMGSQSHGTWIPPQDGGIDDKDVMGICVPPMDYYTGLKKFEQIDTWEDEYDIVIYEARKFVRLLLKANPNVLGLLWLPPELYIKKTKSGQHLINHRDIFSSKQIYNSFTGYAYSQLSKMEHFSELGYMGAKRKALVQKFGYDTKNAAHLIRLLRMGIEFLATGQLNVLRPDAPQLIRIKKGKYTLEKIKTMAEGLFDDARKALMGCNLPDEPDHDKAEYILMDMINEIQKSQPDHATHGADNALEDKQENYLDHERLQDQGC
jgi:predicted nucleotidyltransferase